MRPRAHVGAEPVDDNLIRFPRRPRNRPDSNSRSHVDCERARLPGAIPVFPSAKARHGEVSSDIPIEDHPSITRRAACATAARSAPTLLASAPGDLCARNAVPAGAPRLRAGRAGQMFVVDAITISTGLRRPRVRSAASPSSSRFAGVVLLDQQDAARGHREECRSTRRTRRGEDVRRRRVSIPLPTKPRAKVVGPERTRPRAPLRAVPVVAHTTLICVGEGKRLYGSALVVVCSVSNKLCRGVSVGLTEPRSLCLFR